MRRTDESRVPRRRGLAGQYGERIKAAAVYLNVQQLLLPEDRTAQTLQDLFQAPLACPASVVAWVGKKAQALEGVYRALGASVGRAKVRHLDETGLRIAGKLEWAAHDLERAPYGLSGRPRARRRSRGLDGRRRRA